MCYNESYVVKDGYVFEAKQRRIIVVFASFVPFSAVQWLHLVYGEKAASSYNSVEGEVYRFNCCEYRRGGCRWRGR